MVRSSITNACYILRVICSHPQLCINTAKAFWKTSVLRMNKMFQFIMHRILQVVWQKDVTNDTEIFSQLNLFFGLMNWNKKVTQWGSPNLSQFQKVFCLNASDSIFTTIYVPVRSLKIERGFHSPFVSFFNLFYPLRPLMCRKLFVFEKRIKKQKRIW